MDGSRVTVGANPLHVISMSVYVGPIDSNPAHQLFQVAIYSDSGGRPGSLVAASSSGALTANAWSTVAISATLSSNTTYWLIYNSNGRTNTVNNLAADTGTAGEGVFSNNGQMFGIWPTSFGPATMISADYSMYVTGN